MRAAGESFGYDLYAGVDRARFAPSSRGDDRVATMHRVARQARQIHGDAATGHGRIDVPVVCLKGSNASTESTRGNDDVIPSVEGSAGQRPRDNRAGSRDRERSVDPQTWTPEVRDERRVRDDPVDLSQ
jgi:hypothetical protein